MKVYSQLSSFLQRIQECATHDYHSYVMGSFQEEDLAKAKAFADKVESLYETELSDFQRHYRRKTGVGAVYFFGHLTRGRKLYWVIMATEGEHAFHEMEAATKRHLQQKDSRMALLGFELVLMTRPKVGASPGGIGYTWRLTEDSFKRCSKTLDRIVMINTNGQLAIDQAKRELLWLPMFRGVRVQVGKLFRHMRRQWTITRGDAPLPMPESIPFIRRQKMDALTLDQVLAALKPTTA